MTLTTPDKSERHLLPGRLPQRVDTNLNNPRLFPGPGDDRSGPERHYIQVIGNVQAGHQVAPRTEHQPLGTDARPAIAPGDPLSMDQAGRPDDKAPGRREALSTNVAGGPRKRGPTFSTCLAGRLKSPSALANQPPSVLPRPGASPSMDPITTKRPCGSRTTIGPGSGLAPSGSAWSRTSVFRNVRSPKRQAHHPSTLPCAVKTSTRSPTASPVTLSQQSAYRSTWARYRPTRSSNPGSSPLSVL